MQQRFNGRCSVCEQQVEFEMDTKNFYRSVRCTACGSWPAQRAFWHVLTAMHPDWRSKVIHESSAGPDPVTKRLLAECPGYLISQYNASVTPGAQVLDARLPGGKYVAQDLQSQTFPDAVFDIVVTRDVFEHVLDVAAALAEITRTLRPGGSCIMAVPVVNGFQPSRRRAGMHQGAIQHLLKPQYHGNQMEGGALVTIDWGYDIVAHFSRYSGMPFCIGTFHKPDGIPPDEFNQILFAQKAPLADLR